MTAAARIDSRTAAAAPWPERGSRLMAAEPQASHLGPMSSRRMRGCEGNEADAGSRDSICGATRRLEASNDDASAPTDSSHASRVPRAARKSQPSAADSIQQASEGARADRVTAEAWAMRSPNDSGAEAGGDLEAWMVQEVVSGNDSEAGMDSQSRSSSHDSETA